MYGRGSNIGFGPPVTPSIIKQLLIANAVVFILQQAVPSLGLYGSVIPALFWQHGYIWQPFTYMWLHGGLLHIGMNCFMLWMFGSQLALAWGPKRFFRYYMICGVGAGFIIATWPYLAYAFTGSTAALQYWTVGASGAIYGIVLAYSLTWPDRTIMLIFPPVAFRAIWLIPIMFFMTVYADHRGNISHVGHLGGVLVGWLYLRRQGQTGRLFSWGQLKHRWRRYRMRQKLRAVRYEDMEARRRGRDRDRHDRTLH